MGILELFHCSNKPTSIFFCVPHLSHSFSLLCKHLLTLTFHTTSPLMPWWYLTFMQHLWEEKKKKEVWGLTALHTSVVKADLLWYLSVNVRRQSESRVLSFYILSDSVKNIKINIQSCFIRQKTVWEISSLFIHGTIQFISLFIFLLQLVAPSSFKTSLCLCFYFSSEKMLNADF